MNRVIAYLRVSTSKQENDNQKFGFENYCKKNDLVITEWMEEKVSGTTKIKDRELGGLMDTLEKGDVIIFSEFSRIGRSVYSVFGSLQSCIEKGVIICTIKENFRLTNDIHGRIMGVMLSLIADIERSLLASRVKETYQRKKREAEDKGKKVKWGREKGSRVSPDKRLLYSHKDHIREMLRNNVPPSVMAHEVGTNRMTLYRFLKENNLTIK